MATEEPRLPLRRLRADGGPVSSKKSTSALRSCRYHRTAAGSERRVRGAPATRHRSRPSRRSSQDPQSRAPERPAGGPPTKSGASEEPRGVHYKQRRKEVLKNKIGKLEKITVTHAQSNQSSHKCEQLNINRPKGKSNLPSVKTAFSKRNENDSIQDSTFYDILKKREKKPLHCADNLSEIQLKKVNIFSELSEKGISYAGAKFSDPPSPSVLPKPPRHWVGTTLVHHSDQCKELMASHLKTLLKVQS
ncbi:proline-rich nuclear receptor coactivator 1 [Lissotriton helveticus]